MDGIYEVCATCAALTTDMHKHMAWHEAERASLISATVTTPKTATKSVL